MLPNDFKAQRWRPFVNMGASEVPSFGALEITGMSSAVISSTTCPVLSAKRPTSASLQGAWVNSHLPVPVGAQGIATLDAPMWVLYDTDDTPAYDEDWGTQADSYELASGNTGFKIIGGQTEGRVYVERRSAATTPKKFLYLPLEDTQNYVLPQDFVAGTAYGLDWTISATNYTNIDTGTQYAIKDYYGSVGMPGSKLLCEFSSTLNAWTPTPYGQNPFQLVRTYKFIEANTVVNGSDMFFIASDGGILLEDVVECSELVNDTLNYDWCTSLQNIDADSGNPVELYVYLFHENGGCQFRIIGKACDLSQQQ